MNNKEITIFIKYLVTQKDYKIDVDKSKKVYELKKIIENKLNICIISYLMVKSPQRRTPKCLNDENLTLYECHIKNNDIITIGMDKVKGGGPDEFANLSEEFIRKDEVLSPGSNVPPWRQVGRGINLYGICQQDTCVAKGRQVIMPVHSEIYDVVEESFMGICPMCKKHFDLDTCSFFKCDFQCEGKYFDKRKDEWVDLPNEIRSTSDGKDFYFDYQKVVEGKDGKVKYKKLLLKVIRLHDANDR